MRVPLWLRQHPWITGLLALLGFAVADHFFANWRAEVRWQRYCTEARARGVKLTLAEFAQPKIPDAENFAALPMFRAMFNGGARRPMHLDSRKGDLPHFGNPLKGLQIDWKAWQKYCQNNGWITEITDSPAQDVLRGLEHYAPQIKEWSEWRQRPRCVFPLNLQAGAASSLPHVSAFHDAAKLFSLRARARLALGDSAGAYTEVQDGLQTWRALEEEPTFISGYMQIITLPMLLSAVGAGLKDRVWAEAELEKIAADFKEISVWKSYRRAFTSERAFENWTYEQLVGGSISKTIFKGLTLPTSKSIPVPFALIPKRVYRENQLRNNRYLDEILARVGVKGGFDADAPLASSPENLRGIVEPYYFFFFRESAANSFILERYVTLYTVIDEMRIACALERYHLAHHQYPETLQELTPAFLEAVPRDLFSGKPLIYQRKVGGSYLLYGVGKNRTDEGGAIDSEENEVKQRDDIWLYAPPAS